jgi:hypothetical protein
VVHSERYTKSLIQYHGYSTGSAGVESETHYVASLN